MSVPNKIGNYKVEEICGQGGMAVVYKAHDPVLDRTVAIKQINSEFSGNPKYLDRFRREATLCEKVRDKKHILRIFHIIEADHDGRMSIVMEYVEGSRTLKDWIVAEPAGFERGLKVFYELTRGLRAIHEVGVIHGDLKPSNVMILPDDSVKISDFGIARSVLAEVDSTISGTRRYLAPEAYEATNKITTKVDVYALGFIMYEFFCGEKIFREQLPTVFGGFDASDDPGSVPSAPDEARWWRWHTDTQKKLKDLSELLPGFSPEISALVRDMLEKDEKDRLDAEEAMERLTAYIAESGHKGIIEDSVMSGPGGRAGKIVHLSEPGPDATAPVRSTGGDDKTLPVGRRPAPAAKARPSQQTLIIVLISAAVAMALVVAGTAYYFMFPSFDRLMAGGIKAFGAGEYPKALESFEKAAGVRPDSEDAANWRNRTVFTINFDEGLRLCREGATGRAEPLLKDAAAAMPAFGSGQFGLALLADNREDYPRALALVEDAIAKFGQKNPWEEKYQYLSTDALRLRDDVRAKLVKSGLNERVGEIVALFTAEKYFEAFDIYKRLQDEDGDFFAGQTDNRTPVVDAFKSAVQKAVESYSAQRTTEALTGCQLARGFWSGDAGLMEWIADWERRGQLYANVVSFWDAYQQRAWGRAVELAEGFMPHVNDLFRGQASERERLAEAVDYARKMLAAEKLATGSSEDKYGLLIERAARLLADGDYATALAAAEEAVRLAPSRAEGYHLRGMARFPSDRAGAAADFSRAIELNPRLAQSYLGRARAFFELGRWQLVADDCSRALAFTVDRDMVADALKLRSAALGHLNQTAAAVRDAGEYVSSQAVPLGKKFDAVAVLIDNREYNDATAALDVLENEVFDDAGRAITTYLRARVLAGLERTDEADDFLRVACEGGIYGDASAPDATAKRRLRRLLAPAEFRKLRDERTYPQLVKLATDHMAAVPATAFEMGGDVERDERPRRAVRLSPYMIAKTEVSVAAYEEFLKDLARYPENRPSIPGVPGDADFTPAEWAAQKKFPDRPVVGVTYYAALTYALWNGTNLPTEAQWECAAGGSDGHLYPWGNERPDETRAAFGRLAVPVAVGDKAAGASPFGCLNMGGNVWEICRDTYDPAYYFKAPAEDPLNGADGADVVIRGGSFDMPFGAMRVSNREKMPRNAARKNVGFRYVFSF